MSDATLSWGDVGMLAAGMTAGLLERYSEATLTHRGIYGIPRGGSMVAALLGARLSIEPLDEPRSGCIIVDDVADSGRTIGPYVVAGHPCAVLMRKNNSPTFVREKVVTAGSCDGFVTFPWELGEGEGTGAEDAIVRLLQYIGADPNDEALRGTPSRVLRAFKELTSGYDISPAELLAVTFAGDYDELVLLRDIAFVSVCEHHLMPFTGVAHVGYISNGAGVVGISKLARLVECYAKRLQIQERMTSQIAEALQFSLRPKGVGVVVSASHACMACRGVKQTGSTLVTSSMLGVLRDSPEARAEFMSLVSVR